MGVVAPGEKKILLLSSSYSNENEALMYLLQIIFIYAQILRTCSK
jgi:hypothetical protein